jgi:hypothetical protein
MAVRLQNIDSQRFARKIFWNKDLAVRIPPRTAKAEVVADLSRMARTIQSWNVLNSQ